MCFREFGDRVKYWTTVNEPNIFAVGSYDQGISPPKRCSPPFCVRESTEGNSTFEPYLVVHHILLAHSSAVRLYRTNYRVYPLCFFILCTFLCGLFVCLLLLLETCYIAGGTKWVCWYLNLYIGGSSSNKYRERQGCMSTN